jgi:hypothetical protein
MKPTSITRITGGFSYGLPEGTKAVMKSALVYTLRRDLANMGLPIIIKAEDIGKTVNGGWVATAALACTGNRKPIPIQVSSDDSIEDCAKLGALIQFQRVDRLLISAKR